VVLASTVSFLAVLGSPEVRADDLEELAVYAIKVGEDVYPVGREGEYDADCEYRCGTELVHARTIPSLLMCAKSSKEIDEMLG
jgi:hypothetical protein